MFVIYEIQDRPSNLQGTRVSETTTFRRAYHRNISRKTSLTTVEDDIMAYRGNHTKPEWLDVDLREWNFLERVAVNSEPLCYVRNVLRGLYRHR
jgi:hypothetical protein